MPQLGIAAIAVVAGYGGALAIGLEVGTLMFAVVSTVIAGAVTYGLSSVLMPTSKASTMGATDRKQLLRSSAEPRQVVYGRARVSGPLVYASSSGEDQEYLHLIVPLAGHVIAGVDAVWINEYQVLPNHLGANGEVVEGALNEHARIRWHLGDQTEADPLLMAESTDGWGADHKLLGIAYLYIRLKFNKDLFASGLSSISAEIRGKPVLDPRTGATAFSSNWALCILDYLSSEEGISCQADELDADSFIVAANLADEPVQLDAAGTQFHPRYTLDGAFKLDEKPLDIMEAMITAGCGALTYVQGRYHLHGGAYQIPNDTLTPDDFLGQLELTTKPSRSELFNAVRGTFIDPSRSWQNSEFPAWVEPGFEAEDGERIWRDVEFLWTIDGTRCQRLAKQLVRRARESLTFKVTVRYRALRYSVWQTLAVTVPDLGWDGKVFRIVDWEFDPPTGGITLTLNEEGAGSYGWLYDEAAGIPPSPDTNLINPLTLPVPTDLVLIPTAAINADGTTVTALELSWTSARHAFVEGHEVQWRPAGALTWFSADVASPATRFIISPVLVGQAIEVRIRAYSALVRGAWSAVSNGTGEPDVTPPGIAYIAAVVGLTRAISIRWTNPADRDLAYVEVWESAAGPDGPWGKVGQTQGDSHMRTGLPPAGQAWFRTRAVDRSGNAGGWSPVAWGRASLLVADDLQQGILGTAQFAAGLAPIELVDGLPGTGNFEGRMVLNKADSKLYRFLNGAWLRWVDGYDLGDGTIPYGKLTAGAVRAAEIYAEAIRAEHLATTTLITQASQMGTAVIQEAQIGVLSVDTLKLKAGAVSGLWVETWNGAFADPVETQIVSFVAGYGEYGARWQVLLHLDGPGAAYLEQEAGGEGGNGVIMRHPSANVKLMVDGAVVRNVAVSDTQTTLQFWAGELAAGFHTFAVRVSTTNGGGITGAFISAQAMKR